MNMLHLFHTDNIYDILLLVHLCSHSVSDIAYSRTLPIWCNVNVNRSICRVALLLTLQASFKAFRHEFATQKELAAGGGCNAGNAEGAVRPPDTLLAKPWLRKSI